MLHLLVDQLIMPPAERTQKENDLVYAMSCMVWLQLSTWSRGLIMLNQQTACEHSAAPAEALHAYLDRR